MAAGAARYPQAVDAAVSPTPLRPCVPRGPRGQPQASPRVGPYPVPGEVPAQRTQRRTGEVGPRRHAVAAPPCKGVRMKLIVKFNLVFLLVFVLGLAAAGYVSKELLQRNAREEVVHS